MPAIQRKPHSRPYAIWRLLSRIGALSEDDYSNRRRIILTNQISLLAVVFTASYGVLFSAMYWHQLKPIIIHDPLIIAGYLSVIVLNYMGKPLWARQLLMVVPAVQFTAGVWYLGNSAGIQQYLFVAWAGAFLLSPKERRWSLPLTAGLFVMLYLYCVLELTEPRAQAYGLPITFYNTAFIVNSIGTFAALGYILFLLYIEIDRNERLMRKARERSEREKERSDRLLNNILPGPIADELKENEGLIAHGHPDATIMFADIAGFTRLSAKLPPARLVDILNKLFTRFDEVVDRRGLEKIKTIGDAYMLAGGIPLPMEKHATAVCHAALDFNICVEEFNKTQDIQLALRIGIHSGPVVAGVIGAKKFAYDAWGETVNIASRMESEGAAGQIQISSATYERIKNDFDCKDRGLIKMPGLGKIQTWYLNSPIGDW